MSEYTRVYQSPDFTVRARPNSCFFCDHCTDIIFDSRGPYMWICDIHDDEEPGLLGICTDFVEDGEKEKTET